MTTLARLGGMALDAVTGSAPRLLTIEQVADLCQVSTKTVYRAIRSGALKACRLGRGGAYRVKPEEMESWIEASSGATRERRASRATPSPTEPSAPPARRRSSPRSGSDGRLRVAPRMGGAS
jgi:excisionase family DNA binding protein